MPAKHKGLQRTVARGHKSALCKSVVEIVPPNGSGVGRALLTILNYLLYFVALKNDFYNWCAPWKFLTLATVRRKLFYFVGTFLKYPNFLFHFFRIRTKISASMQFDMISQSKFNYISFLKKNDKYLNPILCK